MLEIVSKKINFTFNGEGVEFSAPSLSILREFQKQLKDNPSDEIEIIQSFFVKCGIKKKIVDALAYGEALQLLKYINEQKKS
jgi:hypothetical protein